MELFYVAAYAYCGKTTIIAHTIQYLESNLKLLLANRISGNTPKPDREPVLLYLLFLQGANPEEEGTSPGAIKTLISQLALQVPDSSSILLEHTKYFPPNHRPLILGSSLGYIH
jgi:hypothetical protein